MDNTALGEVSQAYYHLTNGQLSKLNTRHEHIIEAVEKSYRREGEEVAAEARAQGRREGFLAARETLTVFTPGSVRARSKYLEFEDYERSLKEEHGA